MKPSVWTKAKETRRDFIGGSDARISLDEKALVRLWQEKRGKIGPEDLSTNLIVQLGLATEDLNRQWHERNTAIKDVQCRVMRAHRRHLLPPSRPQFPHTQPFSSAVLGKKFNAGFFQCPTNPFYSFLRNLPTLLFEIYDSRQAQCRRFRELRLGHVQQSASCSTLRGSHLFQQFLLTIERGRLINIFY
jgi:hypothetical protein